MGCVSPLIRLQIVQKGVIIKRTVVLLGLADDFNTLIDDRVVVRTELRLGFQTFDRGSTGHLSRSQDSPENPFDSRRSQDPRQSKTKSIHPPFHRVSEMFTDLGQVPILGP